MLERAEAYLSTSQALRAQRPASEWTAYHRVVGGDLEPADWPIAAPGSTGREEAQARGELAKEMAAWALLVGLGCEDLRCGWREAAAREVERRERRAAARELLRVCMRAWREVADGPRAFAAQYQQARTRAHEGHGDCALARRLAFGGTRWISVGRARPATGRALDVRAAPAAILSAVRTSRVVSTRAWLAAGLAPVQPDSHVCVQGVYYVPDAPRWHDNGWAGQFVLVYMRLVRAGVVRAQRKRSAQWREVQAARHRREANVTSAQEHGARVARWAQQRQRQQDSQRDARHARAAAQPPALPPAQPQQRGNTRSQQPRGSHSGGVEAAAHDADATVDLSVSGACIFRAHECINICEINDCGDNDTLLSNPQRPPRAHDERMGCSASPCARVAA